MMTAQAPFRVYFSDGDAVIQELTENMAAAGLRVVKTFDLRAACAPFTDSICPHHGVAPCDCQLVVLQVYVPGETPVSLVLHSHRGLTEVQWDTDPGSRPSPESRVSIMQAMSEGAGLPFGRAQDALEDAGQDGS
jgi:hypothetical protein